MTSFHSLIWFPYFSNRRRRKYMRRIVSRQYQYCFSRRHSYSRYASRLRTSRHLDSRTSRRLVFMGFLSCECDLKRDYLYVRIYFLRMPSMRTPRTLCFQEITSTRPKNIYSKTKGVETVRTCSYG